MSRYQQGTDPHLAYGGYEGDCSGLTVEWATQGGRLRLTDADSETPTIGPERARRVRLMQAAINTNGHMVVPHSMVQRAAGIARAANTPHLAAAMKSAVQSRDELRARGWQSGVLSKNKLDVLHDVLAGRRGTPAMHGAARSAMAALQTNRKVLDTLLPRKIIDRDIQGEATTQWRDVRFRPGDASFVRCDELPVTARCAGRAGGAADPRHRATHAPWSEQCERSRACGGPECAARRAARAPAGVLRRQPR